MHVYMFINLQNQFYASLDPIFSRNFMKSNEEFFNWLTSNLLFFVYVSVLEHAFIYDRLIINKPDKYSDAITVSLHLTYTDKFSFDNTECTHLIP
jgi:hypothetical protein